MPRLSRLASRRVPLLLAAEAAMAAHRHLQKLTPGERAHLRQLVTRSKGRPSNLTARERDELKSLVRKVDPVGLGRELLPFLGRGRRRRF